MQYLKQNTVATVALGLAVDWRDGKTLLVETPTLSGLACTLYKNGTAEPKTLPGNLTVDANGMILLTLTAADTNTTGRLDIVLVNAVVDGYPSDVLLPRTASFAVLDAAAFDGLTQPPTSGGGDAELYPDVAIDTTTTPWQVVYRQRGTQIELSRKSLYTETGVPITSIGAFVGRQVEVTP